MTEKPTTDSLARAFKKGANAFYADASLSSNPYGNWCDTLTIEQSAEAARRFDAWDGGWIAASNGWLA